MNSQIVARRCPGRSGVRFESPAYLFNYQIYYQGDGDVLKAFADFQRRDNATAPFQGPSTFLWLSWLDSSRRSANGVNNAIVWVTQG